LINFCYSFWLPPNPGLFHSQISWFLKTLSSVGCKGNDQPPIT